MLRLALWLAVLSFKATTAARCDGPYKTLSSDCRGLRADANTACVIVDQRTSQSSPCTTASAAIHPTECAPAARSGQPCDILAYRIDYQTGKARFRITFPLSSNAKNGSRRLWETEDPRVLVAMEGPTRPGPVETGNTNAPSTTPPFVLVNFDTSGPPTAPPPTPPPALASEPAPPPTTPQVLRVDAPTTAPPATAPPATPPPTTPSSTRVDNNPAPTGTRVDNNPTPTGTRVDNNPTPTGTRVDTSPSPTRVDNSPSPTRVDSTTPIPPGTHVDFIPGPTIGPATAGPGTATSTPPPGSTPKTPNSVTGSTTAGPSPTRVDSSTTTGPPTNASDSLDLSAESNDFVNAIGQLKLDPSVTELRIVGGSSEFGTRGVAVQLSIDLQFLVSSPHITSLWIANCNISSQLYTGGLVSGLPQVLTDLNLRNTMMQSEPIDVSALQSLRTLQMGQNYLTTLTSKISLSKLTMLDVSENSLTAFEPALPLLQSLYLNKNNFSEIPRTIYSMSQLQELQMTENSIVAIVVSTTQYIFLAKLRLKLDKPPTTPPTPVIYVSKSAGPLGSVSNTTSQSVRALSAEILGLNLSNPTTDLKNAVAKPVGNLTDLQGVSVWRLSDEEYEMFQAQQDAISKSDIVINGTKVQSYLALAAANAAAAVKTPTPSKTGPDDQKTKSPSDVIDGSTGGKSDKTVTIAIASVATAVVVIALSLFVVHKRQNSKSAESTETTITSPRDGYSSTTYQANNSKSNTQNSMESLGTLGLTMKDAAVRDLFTSRRVRVADIQDIQPISSSASGIIWLVKHRGSRLLASKRLIQNSATTQRMNEFVNEIVIAANLDYSSILRLAGIAWTNEKDLQALYEYMPNGDLQTYLYKIRPASLPWRGPKIQVAIDIIEALVYTHSFNPPLLHRDLRARNVLLDDKMSPKLSNFGSARFTSDQNTMTTDGIGSGRWLAPEILRGSTDYDSASDIYAYGVFLCELDTHRPPYEDVRDVNGYTLAETALMDYVARGRLRPSLSPTCPPQIRDIVAMCLSHSPQDRPPAMRVAYELRLLVREWS